MKKIPLGISSYQQIYDKDCLFVDKTKEIKYIIDNFVRRPSLDDRYHNLDHLI